MKLQLVLVVVGAALVLADDAELDSAKTKRGVQGVYHYATGPFSSDPRILAAPVPLPYAPLPGPAPYPVAAPVPVPFPYPVHAPVHPAPVLPPPHFAYAPTAVGFAPSAVALPVPVPAPVYKVHVPVAAPIYKVHHVPVAVKYAYSPGFTKKYTVRVKTPSILQNGLYHLSH